MATDDFIEDPNAEYIVIGQIQTVGLRGAQFAAGGQGLALDFELREPIASAVRVQMWLPDSQKMLLALEQMTDLLRDQLAKRGAAPPPLPEAPPRVQ